MQKVIDVSEHNGIINWQAVKDAGWHAIIRCGYGDDLAYQDDKQFERNIDECERLGIPHGVYLYSYADSDEHARSEAAHVLRLIKGHALQYPVYLDVEEGRYSHYGKRACEVFGDIIEGAGLWCGVYANRSWWDNHLVGLDRFTKWVAAWNNSGAGIPCDMWQRSSDGSVPGIAGRVDVNECYRDFPGEIGGQAPAQKSVSQLADEVMAGMHGNGDARRASLGSRYDEVQAEVNRRLGVVTTPEVDIDSLARAVIRGDYGNGEERRNRLGSLYDRVQARVNELL